jgi:hypothetical protein
MEAGFNCPVNETAKWNLVLHWYVTYRTILWTSGLFRFSRSRLKETRSRYRDENVSIYINKHSCTSGLHRPVAGMNVRRKLFLPTVKTMWKQQNRPGNPDDIFKWANISGFQIIVSRRALMHQWELRYVNSYQATDVLHGIACWPPAALLRSG